VLFMIAFALQTFLRFRGSQLKEQLILGKYPYRSSMSADSMAMDSIEESSEPLHQVCVFWFGRSREHYSIFFGRVASVYRSDWQKRFEIKLVFFIIDNCKSLSM
jgi:hypothetical protein